MTAVAPSILAAIFHNESAALEALLAIQRRIPSRLEMGLRPVAGGQRNDQRAILAVRLGEDIAADVAAIVTEFHGSIISG
jgi:hypothetical protein